MKIADLCCGSGAFSLGFKQASNEYETVFFNDKNKYCKRIIDQNFNTKCVLGNLNTCVDIPDFDITPNGTTLVVYSSASSTISAVGYNSSDHSIVTPTFEISTYSGFSSGDSIEINSSLSYGQTKVVHVVGNKFTR